MRLLIDIGNTAIKWAIESDGKLQPMNRFSYTADKIQKQLQSNFSQIDFYKITKILVSNVAGSKIKVTITDWAKETIQLSPQFAQVTNRANGLVNAYTHPELLGIDRWLALIAASHSYKAPFCVIDCGTAVTIDGVDQNKHFIGGAILPGLALQRQSLNQSTNAIDQVFTEKIENVFAKNTKQGVLAGTTFAITALIENMSAKLRIQTEKSVTCILTGGDAEVIEKYLSLTAELEPNLVLQGLHLWGKENVLD